MAPEVLGGKTYNEKCDMWSCGVILYLLITGYPPFFGDTRETIVHKIKQGLATYSEPVWGDVSAECKMLVSQLLKTEASERISASAALKSPWFAKFSSPSLVSNADLRISLNNLRTFRTQVSLQKAVLTYVVSRQLTQKAEEKIRRIFDCYDTDKDGEISKEELVAGYKKLYGDTKKAQKEVKHILSRVPLNKNGNIGYNGTFFCRSWARKKHTADRIFDSELGI